MYNWVVYLHVGVIFIFLIQHAAEILVTFKLRQQKEPEGVLRLMPSCWTITQETCASLIR